jgi:hypothetical protein
MQREENKADCDDLAEIWRSAEQRRAEDIRAWLGRFFEQRKRVKASDAEVFVSPGKAGT